MSTYQPLRATSSRFEPARGLRHHVQVWGGPERVSATRPPLVMLHGWMDVGASFQFVVDALAQAEGFERWVLAPDWRGFGLSDWSGADSYWFPDYLGDLDALLDRLAPDGAVDLLGHSMGGNVAMSYAGLRPARVRRLVNLEGFGLPASPPSQGPRRLVKWLDQIKVGAALKPYADLAAVAARLQANNPRLRADFATWLAPHWARQGADGRWQLRADPAHKRVNPVPYRVEETLEAWKLITAPLLWVEGEDSDATRRWVQGYTRAEFEARLAHVPQVQQHRLPRAGHMLHHDQPEALAQVLADFLAG